MTTLSGTNYSQIVAEAQSKVKDLIELINVDGGSTQGVKKTGKSVNIGNLLNGTTNNVKNIVEGNDQQKASAIQDIMNDLMDLFSNLGTGASSKARKDVLDNDKKIEENKKSAEECSQKVSEKVQNILNDCEANATSIAEAIEKIQKLGGDKGKIAEVEQQLQEQLEIIEENKEILSSDAEAGEKKDALVNILNASKAISGLVEQVAGFKEQILEQNTLVEKSSENIAQLTVDSADTISKGISQMQESLKKAGVLIQKQATLSIEAVKNTGTGTAQEATGQAMTNFWATAAQGAKYILSGNDKLNAGTTLMQGATQGLSKLTGSIGEMGQYLTLFTEFGNGVGSFAEGAVQLIGQYDATVNPMIESIGSWDNIAKASEELETYTQGYAQEALGETQGSTTQTQGSTSQAQGQNSKKIEATDIQNADEENMKFKKFEFDTSIFTIDAK